jgi:hypothetical protein
VRNRHMHLKLFWNHLFSIHCDRLDRTHVLIISD